MPKYKNLDDDYHLNGIIGKGAYGTVFKVFLRGHEDTKPYALKVVHINNEFMVDPSGLRECNILSKIIHKNITKVHDIFIGRHDGELNLCVLMDYYERSLLSECFGKGYEYQKAMTLFFQIVDALLCLNGIGYSHCDLSFSNLMLDETDSIKIIDFGSCQLNHRFVHPQLPPTVWIRPIEMFGLEQKPIYSPEKVDSWSLGSLLYFLLTGKVFVMEQFNNDLVYFKKMFKQLKRPSQKWCRENKIDERFIGIREADFSEFKRMYPEERKLLGVLLQYDSKKRPTVVQLLKTKEFRACVRKNNVLIFLPNRDYCYPAKRRLVDNSSMYEFFRKIGIDEESVVTGLGLIEKHNIKKTVSQLVTVMMVHNVVSEIPISFGDMLFVIHGYLRRWYTKRVVQKTVLFLGTTYKWDLYPTNLSEEKQFVNITPTRSASVIKIRWNSKRRREYEKKYRKK